MLLPIGNKPLMESAYDINELLLLEAESLDFLSILIELLNSLHSVSALVYLSDFLVRTLEHGKLKVFLKLLQKYVRIDLLSLVLYLIQQLQNCATGSYRLLDNSVLRGTLVCEIMFGNCHMEGLKILGGQ